MSNRLETLIMPESITTISSRDFARDLASAKRAAAHGPVFITDRGSPRYVLQTVEHYYQSTTGQSEPTLLQVMQSLADTEADFEPPRMAPLFRVPDFADDGGAD